MIKSNKKIEIVDQSIHMKKQKYIIFVHINNKYKNYVQVFHF